MSEHNIRKRTRPAPAADLKLPPEPEHPAEPVPAPEPVIPPPAERSAGDYEVGYGRPPVATRFKPGQSGNPKGRPRGTKNLATIVRDELSAPMTIIEGGQRRRMEKRKVIGRQIIERALKGNEKAVDCLVRIDTAPADPAARSVAPSAADVPHVVTDSDRDIFAELLGMLREGALVEQEDSYDD